MIVVSFTMWPEIFKCRHPTSTHTDNVLNEVFSRFGTPKTLICNNDTQFNDFCISLSIDNIMTFVYHHRSNGLAESFVDTFNRALRKNKVMKADEPAQRVVRRESMMK